jgi:Ca2+-binding RTX toxin-like protein
VNLGEGGGRFGASACTLLPALAGDALNPFLPGTLVTFGLSTTFRRAGVHHLTVGVVDGLCASGPTTTQMQGGRGQDLMRGGPGDDEITGGFGVDRLEGGPGDDLIIARGGGGDGIDCGPGHDTVIRDSGDRLVRGTCGVVRRR